MMMHDDALKTPSLRLQQELEQRTNLSNLSHVPANQAVGCLAPGQFDHTSSKSDTRHTATCIHSKAAIARCSITVKHNVAPRNNQVAILSPMVSKQNLYIWGKKLVEKGTLTDKKVHPGDLKSCN